MSACRIIIIFLYWLDTILYYEVVTWIMTRWTVVVVTYGIISDIFTYYMFEVISNNYSNGVGNR